MKIESTESMEEVSNNINNSFEKLKEIKIKKSEPKPKR